ACAGGNWVDVLSRGAPELERTQVVVRDHLGVILGPAERLDPFGCKPMLVRPLPARNLPIRDVTDEQMLEGELGLACNGGATCAFDELLALEGVQPPFEFILVACQTSEPEHLAHHRGVLQERLLLGW